jgi:hypothetical protein
MSIRGVFLCLLVATSFAAGAGLAPSDAAAQAGFVTETVDSTGAVGWRTSIAIDRFGFPHIGYIAPSPLNDLKYARKSAAGWTVETASDYVYTMSATSLVLDANDNPAMVTGGNEALYIFKNGSSWTVEGIGGFATWFATMALDNNEVPRVLYNWSVYKEAYSRVTYAMRTGSGTWSESTIGSGPFTPISPDYALALDSNNYRHVACVPTNSDTLQYWHSGGGTSIFKTFTRASNCDIALDPLDRPHLAYYDYEQADLILLVRDGLTWTTTTVDQTGDVGRYCSVAVGADGSCHMSYYDADNGDLKYAGRAGPAGAWDVQVVAAAGDVGRWTSIALDDAGRPHIAYYDVTDDDLEYATLSHPVPVKQTSWGALKALMDKR